MDIDQIFATNTMSSICVSPDVIFISTEMNHHVPIQTWDSDCILQTNKLNLAGVPYMISEVDVLKAFASIDRILFNGNEPLHPCFWEQTNLHCAWNVFWSDTAWDGSGISIYEPVFGMQGTKYLGLYFGHFTFCNLEKPCDFEEHNWMGAVSPVEYAPAVVSIAKSVGIPLIVIIPLTPTLTTIDEQNCHRYMLLIHCNLLILKIPQGSIAIEEG